MKVLFIYPHTQTHGEIPIAITTLSAVLRHAGHEVSVFDCSRYVPEEDWTLKRVKIGMIKPAPPPPVPKPSYHDFALLDQDLIETIDTFQPGLVAITATSGTYPVGLKCSRVIKQHAPAIPIVIGGIHPTICPEDVIQEPSVNMICRGEGEDALVELCEMLEAQGDPSMIQNLWVKDARNPANIQRNPLRPFKNLDMLPPQDFSDFNEYDLYRPFDGKIYRMMNTELSRGCVYKCSYCVNHVLHELFASCGRYHRRKSVDVAIEHLKALRQKYQFEMVRFWDEDFTMFPLSYLQEFGARYKQDVNLPFLVYAGTRSLTEEKVACLKDMNCVTIAIGVESGNPWLRKYVLDRDISDNDILEKFDIVHRANIRVSAYNMLGLPFETRDMVFDTIRLNRKLPVAASSVSPFKPYPGTKLYELAKDFGLLYRTPDYMSWQTDLDSPYLSRQQIDTLVNLFPLYTKLPEESFPLLERCEHDDAYAQEMLPKLVESIEFA